MATPHNKAEIGQIAKTVLMPGDPLRAKFIAETFLTDVKQFNDVRNMYGFTGMYEGVQVSVMGSGMGMPSIGIYSYELYTQYNVENIIRIGSAGSYCEEAKVYDVVLATEAYSESSYAKTQSGYDKDKTYPSEEINDTIKECAAKLNIPVHEGCIHSSDVFYREGGTDYRALHNEKGCLAVEMESFALFHNASVLGKKAACLLTISDSFVSNEITTAEERQNSFTNMMKIALDTAVALA
ncbi:MAG: purine-nucleoside phosphorylase [Lachnospiraceae bacterium]|nr:purine-nucleoside phosphorylase [Lachnospiraceae bacterium]